MSDPSILFPPLTPLKYQQRVNFLKTHKENDCERRYNHTLEVKNQLSRSSKAESEANNEANQHRSQDSLQRLRNRGPWDFQGWTERRVLQCPFQAQFVIPKISFLFPYLYSEDIGILGDPLSHWSPWETPMDEAPWSLTERCYNMN